LGVDLDNFDEQQSGSADTQNASADAGPAADSSTRRRFSRNAVIGGAVLLSLGNRSAWGGSPDNTAGCMSVMTLNSFNPEEGHFISAPAGRPEHNEDLAAAIHRIGNAPDYTGVSRDGRWRVCEDPGSLDRVCYVRGECPR